MMKRMSRFVLLWGAAFLVATVADAATIVGVSGDVTVRAAETDPWQAAAKGEAVVPETQIQCGPASRCTVAFDETLRNTVTVKENTTVTVEELEPGLVFLREGRVFSIIRGVAAERPFQVRTPTSISGARGTAWLTDFRTGRTDVSVFEDDVWVSGIDAAGNVTQETGVATGQGVSVAADGLLGEIFVVPVEQINEWHQEKQQLQALHEELGLAPPSAPETGKGAEPEPVAPAEPRPHEPKEEDAAGTAAVRPLPVAGETPPDTAAAPVPPMTEDTSSDPAAISSLLREERMPAEGETQGLFRDESLPQESLAGSEDPMMGGSLADEPLMDEPRTDEPMMEDPMMGDSMMDDPLMDDSMFEDPMMDDPMFEDPMMDSSFHEDITDPDTTNQPPPSDDDNSLGVST